MFGEVMFTLMHWFLTLPMVRPLSSEAQGSKDFQKAYKPCHVGIHWLALAEYFQMSTHMPGFQSFLRFFYEFVLAKLAISSIRVKVSDIDTIIFITFDYWWTHLSYGCLIIMLEGLCQLLPGRGHPLTVAAPRREELDKMVALFDMFLEGCIC